MKRVIGFLAAGGTGFATDAGVLFALTHVGGLDPLLARVFSFTAAVLATWAINRTFAFGASDRSLSEEGVRFGGVALAVGGFNYLVYAGLLLAITSMHPLMALVIASASAMVLSWVGYSRLVFQTGRR